MTKLINYREFDKLSAEEKIVLIDHTVEELYKISNNIKLNDNPDIVKINKLKGYSFGG